MKFELTNDQGEVVLAAESDGSWLHGGNIVYTIGDMNMLVWGFREESMHKKHLILTHAPDQIIYNIFTHSAHHYKVQYTGDSPPYLPGFIDTPGPNYSPPRTRPVYTGKIEDYGPSGRNDHLRPIKSREYILQTKDGHEVVRALVGAGRWHEPVPVTYHGDTSVLKWAGSPAEPNWVFSFFRDLAKHEGYVLVGPDREGEPYLVTLPPGWEFISEEQPPAEKWTK